MTFPVTTHTHTHTHTHIYIYIYIYIYDFTNIYTFLNFLVCGSAEDSHEFKVVHFRERQSLCKIYLYYKIRLLQSRCYISSQFHKKPDIMSIRSILGGGLPHTACLLRSLNAQYEERIKMDQSRRAVLPWPNRFLLGYKNRKATGKQTKSRKTEIDTDFPWILFFPNRWLEYMHSY